MTLQALTDIFVRDKKDLQKLTVIEQKRELRKHMLFKRAKLDKQEKQKYDEWICQTIWEIIGNRGFKNVHCYLPMGTEIDIFPLIKKMVNQKNNSSNSKDAP